MVKKRTNVRSSQQVARALFQVLNPVPAAASELAARLWMSPPRAPVRPPQAATLAQAEHLTFEASGARIAGYAWGGGPAVLLVHGWGGHAGQFASFVSALVEAGHRAVAFDAPRHGASVGGTPTIPAFAEAARRVASEVGGVEAVIAHSMGAAAMAYAMGQGLEAKRAVLLAPPASMDGAAERFARMVGLGSHGLRLLRQKLERRYSISWEELDVRRAARAMDASVLLVHDKEDRDVPYDESLQLLRAWPTATLMTTEGLGHHRILRDPDVVRHALAFIGGEARRAQAK